MLAAVIVLAVLLAAAVALLGVALARLHDVEEAVAAHDLVLGHLTAPTSPPGR